MPEQKSGASQTPIVAGAHCVVAGAQRAGQPVLVPSQTSSTSHELMGSRARQMVPEGNGVDPGHAGVVPLHVPGVEQEPAAEPPQFVPAVWRRSGGQSTLVPEQASATSQPPATARQVTLAPRNVAGHAAPNPLQTSAASHAPPSVALQTVPPGMNASIGQSGPRPVHDSATSQRPPDGRHAVAAGVYESGGQLGPPAQLSATSHAPADTRHTVPTDEYASPGHAPFVPSQTSARSHVPFAARHTVLAGSTRFAQATRVPSQ